MSPTPKIQAAIAALKQLEPQARKKVFRAVRDERAAEEREKRQEARMLPNEHFSRAHLLERLPDPAEGRYEQKIHIPEFSFMGVGNQPDYGDLKLTFYPRDYTIELKSLKIYKDSYREVLASYERIANVMFEDLIEVYNPRRLRLVLNLRARGGISSSITIDSDWAIRGGTEQFHDWKTTAERDALEKQPKPDSTFRKV